MSQRVAAPTWIPLRSIQATRSAATEYLPNLRSVGARLWATEDRVPPFPLTAKLNKLTVRIDRPRLSPEDIKKLEEGQMMQSFHRETLICRVGWL